MRVLIVHGSKMGGTAGLAETLADALRSAGFHVDVCPAAGMSDVGGYDAVVVGGALYASRWHRHARRFVRRNREDLARVPVWMFSSGPLDDAATQQDLAPVRHVRTAMDLVGARGHVTFGGRMPSDAKGFPASAMARNNPGDWRDPAHVARWAAEIAVALRGVTA